MQGYRGVPERPSPLQKKKNQVLACQTDGTRIRTRVSACARTVVRVIAGRVRAQVLIAIASAARL